MDKETLDEQFQEGMEGRLRGSDPDSVVSIAIAGQLKTAS